MDKADYDMTISEHKMRLKETLFNALCRPVNDGL